MLDGACAGILLWSSFVFSFPMDSIGDGEGFVIAAARS